jgi:hypothetical protein
MSSRTEYTLTHADDRIRETSYTGYNLGRSGQCQENNCWQLRSEL